MSQEKMIKTTKISVIVCAYNEENTIQGVIETLIISDLPDEIIVVNDGSTDTTKQVLSRFMGMERVRCIHFDKNRGKGYAMTEAANYASGDVLLFIDADLHNLKTSHLETIVSPLLSGEASMVLGVPVRGNKITRMEMMDPCRPLTGQRALWKNDFMPLFNVIRFSGYGVETILNLHFQEKKKKIKMVFLPFLTHPIKVEKTGLKRALVDYAAEGLHILTTMIKNPTLVRGAIFSAFLRGR